MDTFDSHFGVEIKEFIFPEYNNNKFVDEKMVIFLMVIKKLNNTDTHLLDGSYNIYRPICNPMHISAVMGQVCHMLHMGFIWPGNMMNINK